MYATLTSTVAESEIPTAPEQLAATTRWARMFIALRLACQRLGILALLIMSSSALGVYFGVVQCQKYYETRMNEILKVSGFVHHGKMYSVTLKSPKTESPPVTQ